MLLHICQSFLYRLPRCVHIYLSSTLCRTLFVYVSMYERLSL